MAEDIDLNGTIEKGLAEQREKGNLPKQCTIEMVVPKAEQHKKKHLLYASFEYGLIINMCPTCTSVKMLDEWIPSSDYTKMLRLTYQNLGFISCEEHAPTSEQ